MSNEFEKLETPGVVSGATGLTGAVISGLGSVLAFVSVLIGVLGLVISAFPLLLITLVATAIMVPFTSRADQIVEFAEFGLRSKIYPIWRDSVREWVNLLRIFYNNLICYWNAVNWWFFGLYREALFPTLIECEIGTVAGNLGRFALALTNNLVRYFLTFDWINGNALDFTDICATWVTFVESWLDLLSCSCFDIADIVISLPAFWTYLPIPGIQYLPIPLINPFSAQWADPLYCQFWANLFNGIMSIVGVLLRLVFAIFNAIFYGPPPTGFPRPDFREAGDYFATSNRFFRRSLENIYQRFWDKYIPFEFNFENFLCYQDTIFELIVVGIVNALELLIHIDQVVQYPNDAYYETVTRKDFEQWINLIAAPTVFDNFPIPRAPETPRFIISSYYIDTNAQALPDNSVNPIFGRTRLTECACIFVERLICDQTGSGFACFSSTFQQILQGFDFCCFFTSIGRTIADIFAGAFELTLFISQGSDSFFLFVDDMPYITLLKTNLVDIVRCALSFVTLIPDVGECIRDLLVATVDWILCQIDFLIKVVLGLGTLPYFLVELPDIPNFVTRMDEALDLFVATNDKLIGMTEGTFMYCISFLLNAGFPIPPIPCSSCEVQIFPGVPSPVQIFKRTPEGKRVSNSPMDIMAGLFGASIYTTRVTPLMHYQNKTWNPWILGSRLVQNGKLMAAKKLLPLGSLDKVNEFVDYQKEHLLNTWTTKQQCNARDAANERLKRDNLKEWVFKWRNNMLDDPDCPPKSERQWVPKSAPDTKGYYNEMEMDKRLTVAPTDPPLASCDPRPPCFDLACIIRTTLTFLVHMLNFLARFFNGLIQGALFETDPPTSDFPYFTGEACDVLGKPCFEEDLITAVILLAAPLQCICEAINLVIPVLPEKPREDLCCAVQRIGELLACILQVIINSINAIATGTQNDFEYFRSPSLGVSSLFYQDVSTLFDITIDVVDCLCVLIRALFPLAYIPGFDEATNFDICCAARALAVAIIELVRWILQIIITLATITVDDNSVCYYRLDVSRGCSGTLGEIGFVKQGEIFFNTLLTTADANCDQYCGVDHGRGGLAPCICQVLNSLLPIRDDPASAVSCDPDPAERNCQEFDLCCPFVMFAIGLNDLLKFAIRLLVSLWQPWQKGDDINNCTTTYPVYFANFLFCVEPLSYQPTIANCNSLRGCSFGTPDACSDGVFPDGNFECGKLMPVVDVLVDPFKGILTHCLCVYVGLLDILLDDIIQLGDWDKTDGCFCGPTNGIVRQAGLLIEALINAIVNFIRRFPLQCFWVPCDGPQSGFVIESSFIFNWLGVVADATCLVTSTFGCFLSNLFFLPKNCLGLSTRLFGSVGRWAWQLLFVFVNLFEGIIRTFTEEQNTCVGGDCQSSSLESDLAGSTFSSEALGLALSILFTFPIDLLFGDSIISCKRICNEREFAIYDLSNEIWCSCWSAGTFLEGDGEDVTNVPSPFYIFELESLGRGVIANRKCRVEVWRWIRSGQIIESYKIESTLAFLNQQLFLIPGIPPLTINDVFVMSTEDKPLCNFATCRSEGLCRVDELPTCGSHPDTNPASVSIAFSEAPIDGILIGGFRWFRCLLSNIFNPTVGNIFLPIIQLMSIIWQIWGAVVRVIVACIIFLFSLFYDRNIFTVPGRILGVFSAFASIFTTPLLVPGAKRDTFDSETRKKHLHGPVNRQSFQEFKRSAVEHVPGSNTNMIEDAISLLYDYDVDDCYDNVDACICRNMPMDEMCSWNRRDGVVLKNTTVTTQTMLDHLKTHAFTGNTMCDHVIADIADEHIEWNLIPESIKLEFMHCMDLRVRGERIAVTGDFPPDYFYRDRAKLQLLDFVRQQAVKMKRRGALREPIQEVMQEDPRVYKQYIQRRAKERKKYASVLKKYDKEFQHRSKIIRQRMIDIYHYDPDNMGFEVVQKLDDIWYKYYSGYYQHMLMRTADMIQMGEGRFIPDSDTAFANVIKSATDIGKYRLDPRDGPLIKNTIQSVKTVANLATEAYKRGVGHLYRHVSNTHARRRQRSAEQQRYYAEKKAKIWKAWEHSLLKKTWDYIGSRDEQNVPTDQRWFGAFRVHLNNVITYARNNDDAPTSFWNLDLRIKAAKRAVQETFLKPNWTPEIQSNWAKVQAFGYLVYSKIWPNSLPRDVQERFIFGCNCVLADRILDTTVMLVDYCVNEFMPNMDIKLMGESKNNIESFLNATSQYRSNGFYRKGYRDQFHHPQPQDPHAWIRPKKIMPEKTKRHLFDRQVYQRATSGTPTVGGFNLLDWVVCVVSDLFGDDLSQRLDAIFDDIMDFVENDTLDVADYPNVGLAYWVSFFVRCEWPEYLNCSLGTDLEDGFVTGTIIWLVLLGVSLVLPGPGGALLAFGSFFIWIIIVPIIAFHYSPQCWLLTPSFPFGFGWNVPIWPFPIAFPTLPECLLDQIVALIDKYITDCYDFIIPDFFVNGDICPADPNQMIDVANCKVVGVSDGLQNLLYFGYWTLGSDFTSFLVEVSATCIGMLISSDIETYLRETFDNFVSASDTQQQRQKLCFYITLPSIFLPLAMIFLVGAFLGLVVPALIDLIRSTIEVLFATPASEAIPGVDGPDWFSTPVDNGYGTAKTLDFPVIENTTIGYAEDDNVSASIMDRVPFDRLATAAAYYIGPMFWPASERKKEKKE